MLGKQDGNASHGVREMLRMGIAVGTAIAGRAPHRSVHEAFPIIGTVAVGDRAIMQPAKHAARKDRAVEIRDGGIGVLERFNGAVR